MYMYYMAIQQKKKEYFFTVFLEFNLVFINFISIGFYRRKISFLPKKKKKKKKKKNEKKKKKGRKRKIKHFGKHVVTERKM